MPLNHIVSVHYIFAQPAATVFMATRRLDIFSLNLEVLSAIVASILSGGFVASSEPYFVKI